MSETQAQPSLNRSPHAWWGVPEHPYHRLRVDQHVKGFVGWNALNELMEKFPPIAPLKTKGLERLFAITAFETGGRANEVLMLKRGDFTISESHLDVEMHLSKQYQRDKTKFTIDNEGRKHYATIRFLTMTRSFQIRRDEPYLIHHLVEYLQSLPSKDSLLFPSHTKHHKKFLEKKMSLSKGISDAESTLALKEKDPLSKVYESHIPMDKLPETSSKPSHLSRVWAYNSIRRVNASLNDELKKDLGLSEPWIDIRDGRTVIADELHLFLHWLRAQRAGSLVMDYGFTYDDLVGWFKWKNVETAMHYQDMSKPASKKMLAAKPNFTYDSTVSKKEEEPRA